MVMAIDDFKAQVEDVARPNRFLVQIIPNPSVFETVGDGNLLDIAKTAVAGARVLLGGPLAWFFLVKGISLPSRAIGVLEHKRLGVTRKFGGNPTYTDLGVTFLNDSGMVSRSLMDSWHENIIQQASNMHQQVNKYAQGSTILVEQMGANNLPISIYKYNDVWPSSIEASELSTDQNDVAQEFTVQFTYNTWTRIL